MGWLPRDQYHTSPRARPKALRTFHSARYIEALQKAEATQDVSAQVTRRHGLGTLSNPVFSEMFRRPATAAGGSLLGADLILSGGAVYNPGGGTHHGLADCASGFCYLNDPVLALKSLFANGLGRVAYVDIDAHHSDGVELSMAGTPGLLMISTHEEKRWPFTGGIEDTGGGTAINLPLPRAANDDDFALALHEVILPSVAAHRPDAIVFQCGADAVLEDPLSRLALSNNAHFETLRHLRPLAPRFLMLGGGGYNPWTVGRLWTGLWATLNDIEIPDHLPPKARHILEGLAWHRRSFGPRPDHWTTSIIDTPRNGPISPDVRKRITYLKARHAAWV
jgi:acetoin utilization protein AcuC